MSEVKKNRFTVYLVGILAVFLAGIVTGYIFWGKPDNPPDYRKTLNEVVNYIATIEHKNRKLSDQVTALSDQVQQFENASKAGLPDGAGLDQSAALQARVGVLQSENAALRSAMSQNQAFARENQELKTRNQALQAKLDALRQSLLPDEPSAASPMETVPE